MVNTPTVAFTPTTYAASPTANPEPLFFGRGGMYGGYLNNDIGGKVLIRSLESYDIIKL